MWHGEKPENQNTSDGAGQFDVILADIGTRKISVITVVRGATGLGLKDGKDLVEGAPGSVMQGIDKAGAEKLDQELEAAGASVEIAAASGPAPKPAKKAPEKAAAKAAAKKPATDAAPDVADAPATPVPDEPAVPAANDAPSPSPDQADTPAEDADAGEKFDVILSAIGDRKKDVYDAVRAITYLTKRQTGRLLKRVPIMVMEYADVATAEAAKTVLTAAGAAAEVTPTAFEPKFDVTLEMNGIGERVSDAIAVISEYSGMSPWRVRWLRRSESFKDHHGTRKYAAIRVADNIVEADAIDFVQALKAVGASARYGPAIPGPLFDCVVHSLPEGPARHGLSRPQALGAQNRLLARKRVAEMPVIAATGEDLDAKSRASSYKSNGIRASTQLHLSTAPDPRPFDFSQGTKSPHFRAFAATLAIPFILYPFDKIAGIGAVTSLLMLAALAIWIQRVDWLGYTAWFWGCVIAGLHYIWFTDSLQTMLWWMIGISLVFTVALYGLGVFSIIRPSDGRTRTVYKNNILPDWGAAGYCFFYGTITLLVTIGVVGLSHWTDVVLGIVK